MNNLEFEILAHKLRPVIKSKAIAILQNEDDAEDIAQDTLLKLWTLRDRLDSYKSIDALAHVIARNMCLDKFKIAKNLTIEGIDLPDDAATPIDIMLEHENDIQVDALIKELPDGQQTILRMKHIEGLETSEIARLIGSNEAAVRVTLSRARQKIKQLFFSKRI